MKLPVCKINFYETEIKKGKRERRQKLSWHIDKVISQVLFWSRKKGEANFIVADGVQGTQIDPDRGEEEQCNETKWR